MKKLVLSATFVLASFGAFAANSDVKSNNTVVPVKNNVEVVTISNNALEIEKEQAATCTVTVSLGVVSFSYSWEC